MANVSSEESALRQLQSEQSELLDVIDGLRNLGLGRLIELPQLIVCGDQSCGKSSVLEAISRVRFPVKGGVCTRFATEVILRRSPSPKVAVTIEPGESRTNEEERERLRKFSEHISTATGLPELIEAAKEWMGISSADGPNAGFSDDILKVEIMGPDKPELTLVDLPGLYHSKSREQGTEGIPVVRKLVEKYMSNTRSIILAIISAKSDYNLQEILDLAERYDGKLERTLGIVTKPDTLEANSSEEEIYIEHINNERVKLQLGWHTLKNRNYETRDASDETRDDLERAFFSTGRWTNISREFVGIDALRQRLSGVLLHHIKRHLPGLINDIENKIQDRKSKLVKLGEERSTLRQQRRYLLETSRLFEKIVGQAVNGMYLDRFFGGLYSTSAPDETRLRAVIRDLNEEFAINMRLNGCRRRIVDEASGKSVCAARARDSPTIWIGAPINSEPETIARGDLEREINERARKNRGIELPGNPNQLLVGDLFRDQSKPWERLAREHLLAVWAAVKQFVKLLLIRLTDNSTSPLLLRNILEPELEKMQENMLTKLDELIAYNKRGHPLPFDQTYLTMTRKLQSDRQLALLEKTLLEMYPEAFEPQGKKRLSIQEVRAAVSEARPASDQFGATEVIELMETYYDIAITTFIDNVAILAIENCLVQPLETIFTPLTVEAMEDHEVMRLASEPPYAQANRLQLRSDLDKLTAGLRSCNRYNTQRAFTRREVTPSNDRTPTINVEKMGPVTGGFESSRPGVSALLADMTLRPLSPERTSSRPESSEGKLDGSTELTSALSGKSASTNGGAKSNNLFSLNNFLVKPADTSSKLDAHRANAPLAGNTNSAGSGSTSEFANLEPSRFSGFTTESATEPNRSTSMTPRPTSDLWPFNGSQPAKSLDPKPVSTKPTSGSSSGLFGPGGFGSTQMTFGSSGRLSSGQNSTPQPGGAKDTPGRPVGPTSSTTRLGGRFGGSSNSTFDFGAPMEDSVTSSGSGFFGTNASKKVDEKSN